MIYIVHGEDYAKSRLMVLNQYAKTGGASKSEVEILQISPAKLYELCNSNTLFGGTPFVILDITQMPKGQDLIADYLKILKSVPKDVQLVLLATKALSDKNPFFPVANKIIENKFEITSNVFRFIEKLFEKNRAGAYMELEKLMKEGKDPFYIFSMILYKARVVVKTNKNKEDAVELFSYLYKIDTDVKSGGINTDTLLSLAIEKVLNS